MDRRRNPRVAAFLPVRVWGVDMHWQPFMNMATARNISACGAVIQGIQRRVRAGEIVEVQYGEERAHFRIVWVGSAEWHTEGEIGVQMLPSQHVIWDVNLGMCSEMVGVG